MITIIMIIITTTIIHIIVVRPRGRDAGHGPEAVGRDLEGPHAAREPSV